MSQTSKDMNLLGDGLIKVGAFTGLAFILGLFVIELSRDEAARAGVAGAGAPMTTTE